MNNKLKTAFTLVELLVVIAIVGILSGLIIVGMSSSVQSAAIARSQIFSTSLRNSMAISLISEWKFDGSGVSDGNTATVAYTQDSWSGGNNCTIAGSPLVYSGSNCVYESCLKFNGSTDYLDCGNGSNLNINSAITIEAWIKTNQLYTDQWRNTIGKPSYAKYSIFTEWSAGGGSLKFEIDSGSTRYVLNGPAFSGNVGKWMYIAGTYTAADGILKIYYNGNLYGSSSIGAGKNIDSSSSDHLLIGGNGTINSFNGTIDGVRVYNGSIPTSQIEEQYYSGLSRLLAKGGITKEEYLSNF